MGGPKVQVVLKPPEPQGPATKQENLRSLLAYVQTLVLQTTTGLVNSAPTEHLHGNEALAVKTRLALALLKSGSGSQD